ncbi:MAG: pilus assembly protein [Bdellovibrionales bacterium]|nr:pilus assembly protein [Bdellovibrionales bacterium]
MRDKSKTCGWLRRVDCCNAIHHTVSIDARGVALVHLALILPLLLMFAIGLMDFARLMAVQAIVNKGAENAADLAAKLPNLNIDYRGMDPSSEEYAEYVAARNQILSRAVEFPLATLVDNYDVASAMKLVDFRMVDQGLNVGAGTPPELIYGAAMIRPGERAELEANSGNWVNHNGFPPDVTGQAPPQNQEMLQKRFPIEVYVEADVQMLLPGFDKIRVRGVARSYHEVTPQGPLPVSAGGTGGGPPSSSTSTTTTTTTTTTATTTTTTTAWGCVVNWANCVNQTIPPGPYGRCPINIPDGLGFCLCDLCPGTSGQ